jgi:TRAP-type mannitol/chloroaromatic compound transport system permease small subunit
MDGVDAGASAGDGLVSENARPELIDASLAEARKIGGLPQDMPRWMATIIGAIDRLNLWVGRIVCWLLIPLMLGMVYEVAVRKLFTAPTIWAFDVSRMLYGAHFMLGAAYVLSRGLHIRSDFLYRDWTVRMQARVDLLAYIVFFFPTMLLFLWVSFDYAWAAVSRGERSTETALMPLLGPIKSCIPATAALLILQGVSELLKCVYALQKGRWPHQ